MSIAKNEDDNNKENHLRLAEILQRAVAASESAVCQLIDDHRQEQQHIMKPVPHRASNGRGLLKRFIVRSRPRRTGPGGGGSVPRFASLPSLGGAIPPPEGESSVAGNDNKLENLDSGALPPFPHLQSVDGTAEVERRASLARILRATQTSAALFTLPLATSSEDEAALPSPPQMDRPSRRHAAVYSHGIGGSRLRRSIDRLRSEQEARRREMASLAEVARTRSSPAEVGEGEDGTGTGTGTGTARTARATAAGNSASNTAARNGEMDELSRSVERLARIVVPPPPSAAAAAHAYADTDGDGALPMFSPNHPLRRGTHAPKPSAETAGTAIWSIAKKDTQRASAA